MRTAVVILLLSLGACGFGDDGKLQALIDAPMADAPVDAMVDAPPMERVFEVMPTPALAIPDNNATGVEVPITATDVTFSIGLNVTVDVTHTYRGDVVITFKRGAAIIKTLKPRGSGDGVDDIKETYQVSMAELGAPLNDTYSVHFADLGVSDTGTVNRVRLTFRVR